MAKIKRVNISYTKKKLHENFPMYGSPFTSAYLTGLQISPGERGWSQWSRASHQGLSSPLGCWEGLHWCCKAACQVQSKHWHKGWLWCHSSPESLQEGTYWYCDNSTRWVRSEGYHTRAICWIDALLFTVELRWMRKQLMEERHCMKLQLLVMAR